MSGLESNVAFSPDELRRIERVDQLFAEAPAGIDELLGMLDDRSWSVRRAVVAALGASGPVAVAPLCRLLLTRRDSEARVAAVVDALVSVTGDAETTLIEMTAGGEAAILADVAQILGRRRSRAGLPALVKLTRHPDDNVAVAAIEGLGRIGGRAAVDSLVAAVKSGNFFRTFPAIDVLGRSGDPRAVAPLTELLEAPHYAAEAARALGRTGDLAAVGPLTRFVARGSGATARVAALALKDLHQRHRERFGGDEALEDAIRVVGGEAGIARPLMRALGEGDVAEQVAIVFVLGALRDPSAAPLLTSLMDATAEVAEAAVAALRRLGPEAEDQILRGIREGDASQRRALLPLLSRANSREVGQCLGDADADVRALACEALARMGLSASVGLLFPLLADANPRVAFAAMAAIQSLGSRETERLALEAAHSPDARVRRSALRILSYFGSAAALDDVLRARSDVDERVRESAIQGLPFMDDPRALEALLAAARDPSERTRAAAMRSLGMCRGDLRVSAYLLKGLDDADPWVRYYACQALGKLAFEPAVEAMVRLLADPAGQVRVAAVEALSSLTSEPAMAALKTAVSDADSDIQRAAMIGLGVARREEAVPVMLAAASSPDPATRLVAVAAFAGFGTPEVLRALQVAAVDPDDGVRTAAIGFLAATPGVAATRVLTDLLRTAASPEPVLTALSTHIEGRVAGLVTALEGADDEAAAALTSALLRLRRPDASAALMGVMATGNLAARKAAASALTAMATREALAVLRTAADHDPEPEVRQICSLLLAR